MFIYGKHFSRMYHGSMVGAGFGPYAVLGYVISNQQPGSDGIFRVDLNCVLLATTFGETESSIEKAIDYLCAPDAKSTTPTEDGRRLVKEGPFLYRVVNGALYAQIRNEEERREQNRLAQERHRKKKKGDTPATPKMKTVVMPKDNEPGFMTDEKLRKLRESGKLKSKSQADGDSGAPGQTNLGGGTGTETRRVVHHGGEGTVAWAVRERMDGVGSDGGGVAAGDPPAEPEGGADDGEFVNEPTDDDQAF